MSKLSLSEMGWGVRDAHPATTYDGPAPPPRPPEPEPDFRGFFKSLTREELEAFGQGRWILSVSEARNKDAWRAADRKAAQHNLGKREAVARCVRVLEGEERIRAQEREQAATDGGADVVDRPRTDYPPVTRRDRRVGRRRSILDDPGTRRVLALGAGALALIWLLDAGGRS